MKNIRTKLGFTLTELMVVVVIIGILSVVAIPAYRNYITDSKIAEAYSNIDAAIKGELAFFTDNAEFYYLAANPATITGSMTVGTHASWDQFGYAVTPGSNVYFSYSARSGKIDAAGVEQTVSTVAGNVFNVTSDGGITKATTSAGDCNDDATAATTYGVSVQNGLDWVIIKANGDLNGENTDGKCTAILKVIQTNPGSDVGPSSGGFIVVNKGS